jgi:hypothetical protein
MRHASDNEKSFGASTSQDPDNNISSILIEKKHNRTIILKLTAQMLISPKEYSLQPGNDEPNGGRERFGGTFDSITVISIELLLSQYIFLKCFALDDEQSRS